MLDKMLGSSDEIAGLGAGRLRVRDWQHQELETFLASNANVSTGFFFTC